MSHLRRLYEQGKLHCTEQVARGVFYEALMGSEAYGVSTGGSDRDVYAISFPSKQSVCPKLQDYIPGFDTQSPIFTGWLQHHVQDGAKQWDFQVFGIAKFFRLCADGNPNIVDALFVPRTCVLYSTPIGEMLRENRKLFLSKKCWHTFKGYAYSQLKNIYGGKAKANPDRQESLQKYGFDVKFAYHVVRLLEEVEQILAEGDLDLQRSREMLKSIRRGEWSQDRVLDYFNCNEARLEKLYSESTAVPYKPDEGAIRELLLECIAKHL